MTISDDELVKWDARSRSTYAGLRSTVPVTQIIAELRDARRKLAAVERLADEYEAAGLLTDALFIRIRLAAGDASTEATCKHGVTYSHRLTIGPGPMCPGPAALAAGEAPTEPATRPSRCEHKPWHHVEGGCLHCDCIVAAQPNDCGPVPQGGTTEQEQQQ